MVLFMTACLLSQFDQINVPHGKDETSLVRVQADTEKYLDEEIVICGGIQLSDYYNYGYAKTGLIFHALHFCEIGETLDDRGAYAHLYLDKQLGKSIVDELVKAAEANKKSVYSLVRAKVKLNPGRYFNGRQWNMFEVVDVQFISKDLKSWEPWKLEAHYKAIEEAEHKRMADAKQAAKELAERIAAGEKAKEEAAEALERARWREWTKPDGKKVKGKFNGINSGNVKLILEDKSALKLTITDLPKDEQTWLKEKRWLKPVPASKKSDGK